MVQSSGFQNLTAIKSMGWMTKFMQRTSRLVRSRLVPVITTPRDEGLRRSLPTINLDLRWSRRGGAIRFETRILVQVGCKDNPRSASGWLVPVTVVGQHGLEQNSLSSKFIKEESLDP